MTKAANTTNGFETPTFKQTIWMHSLLIFGWLITSFIHRFSVLYRGFIKVTLCYYRWKLQRQPDSARLLQALNASKFAVLYHEKAAWAEFAPLMETFSAKRRVQFAEHLFYLFWINERFDEARTACAYWQKSAYSWIDEHPSEAKQALNLLRKTYDWKPGYGNFSKVAFEASFKIRRGAYGFGGLWVTRYRNGRLAGLILDWLKEKDYAPARQYLGSHKIDRNPSFPPGYLFQRDFGYSVMEELGMDKNIFLNLCRRAEQFEITSKQTATE